MSDDPVLQALGEIQTRLGRVEGNVVTIKAELAEVKTVGKATHDQATKTNGRVTKLEKAQAYAAGAKASMTWAPKLAFALVVAVAGGGAGALLSALVG